MVKIDLACGTDKKKGFIGVDIVPGKDVDIVHDLETYPWPFEDNYADEVVVSHYVEHLPYEVDYYGKKTDGFIAFMNEVYRIMKKGATCTIISPYATSVRAWQDPTHRRAISEASFLYTNKKWREEVNIAHYDLNCDFDYQYGYQFYEEWANRSEEAKQFAVQHYNNVVSDIQIILTKR